MYQGWRFKGESRQIGVSVSSVVPSISNIEKLIKQAIVTFSKPQPPSKYQESFNTLSQSVSKITAEDVGIDKEFVKIHNRGVDTRNPVGYVPVYEDTNVLVSVFVLKSDSVIPLHDHPVMHGILKVLQGSVHVESYSLLNERIKSSGDDKSCSMNDYYHLSGELYRDPIIGRRNTPVILSANDGNCGILTPFENNIHEVSSVNGPAAFLDILAPPYDSHLSYIGPRPCSYFNIENRIGNECKLLPSVNHSSYWTVELPYKGPKIKV